MTEIGDALRLTIRRWWAIVRPLAAPERRVAVRVEELDATWEPTGRVLEAALARAPVVTSEGELRIDLELELQALEAAGTEARTVVCVLQAAGDRVVRFETDLTVSPDATECKGTFRVAGMPSKGRDVLVPNDALTFYLVPA